MKTYTNKAGKYIGKVAKYVGIIGLTTSLFFGYKGFEDYYNTIQNKKNTINVTRIDTNGREHNVMFFKDMRDVEKITSLQNYKTNYQNMKQFYENERSKETYPELEAYYDKCIKGYQKQIDSVNNLIEQIEFNEHQTINSLLK